MFKSIRVKLTLYFSLFIGLILLGTSYLLYQNSYKNEVSNIDGSLYIILNDLNNDIKEDGLDAIDEDIEELQDKFRIGLLHTRIIDYDIKNQQKSVVAKSSTTNNQLFASFELKEKQNIDETFYKTFNFYRTAMQVVYMEDEKVEFLQVSVALSFKNDTLITIIVANLIVFLLSVLSFYLLVSQTFLPVNRLINSVSEIEAYNYTKRVSAKSLPNEILKLVDMFNKLLARHEASFSKVSQFSSDASHELRTPMTSIRGEIEVGLRKERSSKEYQQILEKSLSQIIGIQERLDNLLFLAKTDKLEIKSSFKELYMDEILSECVEELADMAKEKSIDIKMMLIPVTVRGNCKLLKVVCINLLKNAILYSPNNRKIELSIEEFRQKYVLTIKDQGIGISKDDIEHIFDRFYRVNKVKTAYKGGLGLGLSIVKMILDIHDFEISMVSTLEKGTEVKIFIEK